MELKPCPLCNENVAFQPYKNNGLKIQCRHCGIAYQQRTLRYGLDWLKEKMTETWNLRAFDRTSVLDEVTQVVRSLDEACTGAVMQVSVLNAIRALKTKEGE
jgi:hypothetical protein